MALSTMMAYAQLEARVAAWAEARPDIRLALVVGSRARALHPGDEWADLDIVMFTTEPARYVSAGWLAELGEVWVAYRDQFTSDAPEWMAVLADGLDLDVAVLPVEGTCTVQAVEAAHLEDVLRRGVRPLVDKDGVLALPLPPPPASPSLPDEAAFHNTVQCFWRYAERTAKKLRRGELWMAKNLCDGLLKNVLLTMIEWHVQAGEPEADTWYDGHFLEAWAAPRALEGLRGAYARYDADDIWRALLATMDLFRWLAVETAARLGYAYPVKADESIAAWVNKLFRERSEWPNR